MLHFITEFATYTYVIKGSENIIAGMLSRITAITSLNPTDYEEISKVQFNYPKFQNLIENPQILQLK